MSFLDKMRSTPPNTPMAMLLYGLHGSGKTSLAAQFPKPVFLIHEMEDGIGDLQSNNLADKSIKTFTASNWLDVHECVDWLLENDHEFETLVVDEFGGFETLMDQHIVAEKFGGDVEAFHKYKKGTDEQAPVYWRAFQNKMQKLRTKKNMRVIVLSHAQIVKFVDPLRAAYDRIVPNGRELIRNELCEWVSTIGYIDFDIESVKDKDGRQKGKGGEERNLHLNRTAVFEGKNRWNVTDAISMGNSAAEAYSNLTAAIKAARNTNTSKPE